MNNEGLSIHVLNLFRRLDEWVLRDRIMHSGYDGNDHEIGQVNLFNLKNLVFSPYYRNVVKPDFKVYFFLNVSI